MSVPEVSPASTAAAPLHPPDPNCSMAEGLAHYLAHVSILKKSYLTEKIRVQQLQRAPIFVGRRVRDITSVDIATYRDSRLAVTNPRTGRPLRTSTVRLELSLLSNFFEIARIEWGLCDANPVANVRKPKIPPGRDRRLTAREERLILRYCHNHVNPELYSIVILALETACRQGEILRLRHEHINLKSRVAHLPETKNGTKRDVPLTSRARDAIVRLGTKPAGPVFRISGPGLKSSWRFMLQRLGITDLHFHDLRHEAVSRLFESGLLDMMEVAAISGHKSLMMLKRYTHLRAERLAKKLEGPRRNRHRAVLDQLIPYPAALHHGPDGIYLRLLDFDDCVVGPVAQQTEAVRLGQDALLRKILSLMQAGEVVPPPDQYLTPVEPMSLLMIDPMATDRVATIS